MTERNSFRYCCDSPTRALARDFRQATHHYCDEASITVFPKTSSDNGKLYIPSIFPPCHLYVVLCASFPNRINLTKQILQTFRYANLLLPRPSAPSQLLLSLSIGSPPKEAIPPKIVRGDAAFPQGAQHEAQR